MSNNNQVSAESEATQREQAAITDAELDEFSELEKRATQGPWEWSGPTRNELTKGINRCYVHRVPGCGGDDIPPEKFFISIESVGTLDRDYADAEFTAAARNISPRLVERVREQDALLTRWKSAVEGLTPQGSEYVDDPEACAAAIRERCRYPSQIIALRQQVKEQDAIITELTTAKQELAREMIEAVDAAREPGPNAVILDAGILDALTIMKAVAKANGVVIE